VSNDDMKDTALLHSIAPFEQKASHFPIYNIDVILYGNFINLFDRTPKSTILIKKSATNLN